MRMPALCEDCGLVFASGYIVRDVHAIRFEGHAQTCSRCGGLGWVPDGTFKVLGDTLEILRAPGRTIADLRRMEAVLRTAASGHGDPDEVLQELESVTPQLSALWNSAPRNRSEWYAFLQLLLGIVIFLQTCSDFNDDAPVNVHIDVDVIINQAVEQVIQTPPAPMPNGFRVPLEPREAPLEEPEPG